MKQNVADCHAQAYFVQDAGETSNTDAVATLAADTSNSQSGNSANLDFWVLDWIVWSYSGGTPAGRLTATWGSTVLLDIDITNAGPGELRFGAHAPLYHTVQGTNKVNYVVRGEALVVRLYAGGSGVTGKVSFRAR